MAITEYQEVWIPSHLPRYPASVQLTNIQRVYALLAQIPRGKVSSYAALSKALSSSPRAVGGALRRNPYAPEVPCHRIICADGVSWCQRTRRLADNMYSLLEVSREMLRMLLLRSIRLRSWGCWRVKVCCLMRRWFWWMRVDGGTVLIQLSWIWRSRRNRRSLSRGDSLTSTSAPGWETVKCGTEAGTCLDTLNYFRKFSTTWIEDSWWRIAYLSVLWLWKCCSVTNMSAVEVGI